MKVADPGISWTSQSQGDQGGQSYGSNDGQLSRWPLAMP